MNTAAGLVTGLLRPGAPQMASDPAAPVAADGDFTAALATACMADPQTGMPEDMQSAAALAWLASMAGSIRPVQSQQGDNVLDDSSDAPAADVQAGGDLSAAALSLLQGMLAPVASNQTRDSAAGAGVASTVLNVADAARAVALTAEPANKNALMTAARADLREMSPDPAVQPEMQETVGADDLAAASIMDGASADDAASDSGRGERLIGALAERASMRADSGGFHSDADRSVITGPNLYTATRETVAGQAGQASSAEVVHSTVGSPRWANELGSRLAMMSVRGQQEGSLSLTPEHLGPLEVRISVNQDTTNVWFGAQHADTRAALADALPRLREMFAASGLALGHAGVSHEMPGQEARRGEGNAPRIATDVDSAEILPVRGARVTSGLLDTWA